MVIYGIAGRPNSRLGCGKSTLLTWLALTYQARFDQKICANYHINVTNFRYLENPREIIGLFDSFIALDDIYRYLGFENSRSKKLGRLMAGEIRHHNNNMAIVSSRLKEYIHKSLRDHVDYWLFPQINNGWLVIDVLNAEGETVPGVIPRTINPAIVKKVWTFYNHREDIRVTDYF
jgi:hypothetical protein